MQTGTETAENLAVKMVFLKVSLTVEWKGLKKAGLTESEKVKTKAA